MKMDLRRIVQAFLLSMFSSCVFGSHLVVDINNKTPYTKLNQILPGFAIVTMRSRNLLHCAKTCVQVDQCVSYNYEYIVEHYGICQLNKIGFRTRNGVDPRAKLVPKPGFLTAQIKIPPLLFSTSADKHPPLTASNSIEQFAQKKSCGCKNRGVCVLLPEASSVRCLCQPGFHGPHCQYNDKCISLPCFNGGVCWTLSNYYICQCPKLFYGDQCELSVLPQKQRLGFIKQDSKITPDIENGDSDTHTQKRSHINEALVQNFLKKLNKISSKKPELSDQLSNRRHLMLQKELKVFFSKLRKEKYKEEYGELLKNLGDSMSNSTFDSINDDSDSDLVQSIGGMTIEQFLNSTDPSYDRADKKETNIEDMGKTGNGTAKTSEKSSAQGIRNKSKNVESKVEKSKNESAGIVATTEEMQKEILRLSKKLENIENTKKMLDGENAKKDGNENKEDSRRNQIPKNETTKSEKKKTKLEPDAAREKKNGGKKHRSKIHKVESKPKTKELKNNHSKSARKKMNNTGTKIAISIHSQIHSPQSKKKVNKKKKKKVVKNPYDQIFDFIMKASKKT